MFVGPLLVRPGEEALPPLPGGSPFGDVGPHGDLFQFWGPKKVPIFLFQAEERVKSESTHYYLLNVHHLNLCDGNTSFNESHASFWLLGAVIALSVLLVEIVRSGFQHRQFVQESL